MTPEQRYNKDPKFRETVLFIANMLNNNDITTRDLVDATRYAMDIHSVNRINQILCWLRGDSCTLNI